MKVKKKNKSILAAAIAICVVIVTVMLFGSCASLERCAKTIGSDLSGGLDRIVNVYDYQGDLIASYEGQIDLQEEESKVLFDLDGKRYIYYNAVVEVIEK